MQEDEPVQDPKLPEDARLTSLEERLRKAQAEEAERTGRTQKPVDDNYRMRNRVLADLIGGLAGGALIGCLLDPWLGTSPWLLLALMFLGIAAAFRNIIARKRVVSGKSVSARVDPGGRRLMTQTNTNKTYPRSRPIRT